MRHFKIFLLLSFLCGCTVQKSFVDTVRKESIPPDLKNPKYVLLIEKPTFYGSKYGESRQTKMITRYMKDYSGKWEWASLEDLKTETYSDVEKYRYFLRYNRTPAHVTETISAKNGASGFSYNDQIFVDRKEKKEYPSTGNARSDYAWGIANLVAYLKNF